MVRAGYTIAQLVRAGEIVFMSLVPVCVGSSPTSISNVLIKILWGCSSVD
jgi:hypothetical protein